MPHCTPEINNIEDLYQLVGWVSFSSWIFLMLGIFPWRNKFYQHLKKTLKFNFHRLLFSAYMMTLMFFGGCAAWRIYTCGNFEHRAVELCLYIVTIAVMSTIPMVALRFYSIVGALAFSLMSFGFSLAVLVLFAAHDVEATIVMAFMLGTSAVFVLFFAYALYYRTLIYTDWVNEHGSSYVVMGDDDSSEIKPEQEEESSHMKKHNKQHKHSKDRLK
jgi:phosphoglycerol transferase MdoB-like AlkP superfamily enzyme